MKIDFNISTNFSSIFCLLQEYPMQSSSFEEMNYDSPFNGITTEELVPITTSDDTDSEFGSNNFAFDRLLIHRRKTRANIRALAQRLLAARKNYHGNDRKLLPRLY